MKALKNKLLVKSLIYDGIGMASSFIPLVGPLIDLAWAPIAAGKMKQMYPGKNGKLASIIVFLEEILPFTDVIPTFTLMWVYTYVWSKKPAEGKIIDVEIL